jgi:hypothetical protein
MANDFSSDSSVKAVYNFDSTGALTTDSSGNGNTLEHPNDPTAYTSDKKQGAASASVVSAAASYFRLADASLSSGFPLKSGDTNKNFSYALWFKMAAEITSNHALLAKYGPSGQLRSFLLYLNDATNKKLDLLIGYNNGYSQEIKNFFTGVISGRWYHLGVTYKDSTKTAFAKLVRRDAGDTTDDLTQTATQTYTLDSNGISPDEAYFAIGARYEGSSASHFGGLIDEVVIRGGTDVWTEAQIDQVRNGTYGAPTGGWTYNIEVTL